MNFQQPFVHCGICFKSYSDCDSGGDSRGLLYLTSCAHILCGSHVVGGHSNINMHLNHQNIKIDCPLCQATNISLKLIDAALPEEIMTYFQPLPQQLESMFAVAQFQYCGMNELIRSQKQYIDKLITRAEKQRQLLVAAKDEIAKAANYKDKIRELGRNNSLSRARVRELEFAQNSKDNMNFRSVNPGIGNAILGNDSAENNLLRPTQSAASSNSSATAMYGFPQSPEVFPGADRSQTFARMVRENSTKRASQQQQQQQQGQILFSNASSSSNRRASTSSGSIPFKPLIGNRSNHYQQNQIAESTNIGHNSGIKYNNDDDHQQQEARYQMKPTAHHKYSNDSVLGNVSSSGSLFTQQPMRTTSSSLGISEFMGLENKKTAKPVPIPQFNPVSANSGDNMLNDLNKYAYERGYGYGTTTSTSAKRPMASKSNSNNDINLPVTRSHGHDHVNVNNISSPSSRYGVTNRVSKGGTKGAKTNSIITSNYNNSNKSIAQIASRLSAHIKVGKKRTSTYTDSSRLPNDGRAGGSRRTFTFDSGPRNS